MRNVKMLRTEPNFVSIPAEMAIYCENVRTVKTSRILPAAVVEYAAASQSSA
jgi:hypothetical protein